MSFLDATGEDEVTVNEALAFIDSFDSNLVERESTAAWLVQTPTPESDASSAPTPSQETKRSSNEKPRRKKKSNPPGYTTKVQRRKRAELQSLRDEARDLELRLDQLRRMGPSQSAGHVEYLSDRTDVSVAKWRELVQIEANARREAEETNRKLKQILARQLDANKNLHHVLHKKSLFQGAAFVFGNEPPPSYPFAAFENNKAIVGLLEELVGNLYLESGRRFDGWPSSSSGYSMRMKHDKGRGKVAEMKGSAPAPCTMQEAAELVWQIWSGAVGHDPQKWMQRMPGRKPNSQEKNWILSLQLPSSIKQVKGIQVLQKFEEPNRIVLVKADMMTLTSEELKFRDLSWTIITRSETDPQHASVVRIDDEIFMDPQEGFSARAEDVAYAQNTVLNYLSWKLHECSHKLQDALIDQFQRQPRG